MQMLEFPRQMITPQHIRIQLAQFNEPLVLAAAHRLFPSEYDHFGHVYAELLERCRVLYAEPQRMADHPIFLLDDYLYSLLRSTKPSIKVELEWIDTVYFPAIRFLYPGTLAAVPTAEERAGVAAMRFATDASLDSPEDVLVPIVERLLLLTPKGALLLFSEMGAHFRHEFDAVTDSPDLRIYPLLIRALLRTSLVTLSQKKALLKNSFNFSAVRMLLPYFEIYLTASEIGDILQWLPKGRSGWKSRYLHIKNQEVGNANAFYLAEWNERHEASVSALQVNTGRAPAFIRDLATESANKIRRAREKFLSNLRKMHRRKLTTAA